MHFRCGSTAAFTLNCFMIFAAQIRRYELICLLRHLLAYVESISRQAIWRHASSHRLWNIFKRIDDDDAFPCLLLTMTLGQLSTSLPLRYEMYHGHSWSAKQLTTKKRSVSMWHNPAMVEFSQCGLVAIGEPFLKSC